jgi:hypothetical protein
MATLYYKFLTKAPLIKKIRELEWEELSIFTITDGMSVSGKIKVTRLAGTTATLTYPVTTIGNRLTLLVSRPVGETFTALKKMEAWLETGGSRITEIRTFLCDQTAYLSPIRMGWLNSLGGIDYYTFTGQRNAEVAVDRSNYMKDLTQEFTGQDRGLGVLRADMNEEIEAISNFEHPDTIAWLKTLLGSPEHWVIGNEVSASLTPVVISTKQHVTEKAELFQMKIKFVYANGFLTQNG